MTDTPTLLLGYHNVMPTAAFPGKRRLEEVGVEVTTFAYPRGTAADDDDEAVRLVREAGYRHAITTIPGLNVAGTAPLRLRASCSNPRWTRPGWCAPLRCNSAVRPPEPS